LLSTGLTARLVGKASASTALNSWRGCFCNDLRYVAHAKGVALGNIAVSVTVELNGDPLLATAATMVVTCEAVDGSSSKSVIEEAKLRCMAINSLRKGIPVTVRTSP
jgi:organic hydroperoxide reductase OsmC/OhrA